MDHGNHPHLRLVKDSSPPPTPPVPSAPNDLAQIRADLAWLRADAHQKNVMLKASSYDLSRLLSAVAELKRLVLSALNRTSSQRPPATIPS